MILVVGGTGTLGGRIVRGLLEKGKDVRVLVRANSPSAEMATMGMATAVDTLVAAGAQTITGELTDRDSLVAACIGVDVVITTATSTKRDGDLETVDLHGTLNLIAAAKEAGVKHFVYTSAYGSMLDHPVPLFHIKATCEQALLESGMNWTILLPTFFPEVWVGMVVGIPLQAKQPVTLVGKGDHRHSFISEGDVAAFAIASVDNPAAQNSRIVIGGPSYSWTEVVTAAGKAMGQDLPISYVMPGSEIPLLPPFASALLTGHETYETFIDMDATLEQFNVKLTPLTAVLQQMFGSR